VRVTDRRLAPQAAAPAATAPAATAPAATAPAAPGFAGQGPTAADGPAAAPALRLTEVSKVYGRGSSALRALDSVSLRVAPGEFVCLIGASGCGKSTLLNLAAGLDTPTSGRVSADGQRVSLMFQEPALFPWLTARRNVEIALRARGVRKAELGTRTAGLLDMVHLGGFGGKRPHELSGGMRQRVALARALAQDADVLLMDEPFGALDAMTRDLLHDELERICAERTLSVLFVTHNVREAARLGDRVILLSSRPGRIIEEYAVPRRRPRRIDSAQVAELAAKMTDRLREEMRRHGN
jgi:NitT/TauT family transport system ATP-binding protein